MQKPPGRRQVGRFVWNLVDDSWVWDDEVFAIHGYTPGEVEPTTGLFLKSKHDNDRQRVLDQFQRAATTGEPFSIYYRVVGGDGQLRRVVVVGEGERDDDGKVGAVVGYYIDLTPDFQADSAAVADAAVAASARGRDVIEQAKGALMLAYGLDADAAFAMLRWWSRNRNVKVRDIATGLIEIASYGHATHPGLRRLLDGLLDDLTTTAENMGDDLIDRGATATEPAQPAAD